MAGGRCWLFKGPTGGGGPVGRGELANPGGAPQGVLLSPTALLGLAGAHPEPRAPIPICAVPPLRPIDANTTSSPSSTNADDPRTPFGLGDLLTGDPEPELPSPPPLVHVVVGRAMGAMGRATGPGPSPSIEPRLP
jgi:hypothetical protein